jgi:hypothetical protein
MPHPSNIISTTFLLFIEKEFEILKTEFNQLVKLPILCQGDKIPPVNFYPDLLQVTNTPWPRLFYGLKSNFFGKTKKSK